MSHRTTYKHGQKKVKLSKNIKNEQASIKTKDGDYYILISMVTQLINADQDYTIVFLATSKAVATFRGAFSGLLVCDTY